MAKSSPSRPMVCHECEIVGYPRAYDRNPRKVPVREAGLVAGVSTRTARIAWSVMSIAVALFALRLILLFLTPEVPLRGERSALDFLLEVLLLAFPTIGALIASRRPENPIGWIFCAAGFVCVFQLFSEAYADFALFARQGSLPGTEYMAWISQWIAFPTLLLAAVFLFLLFPDGSLPSRRWLFVAWMATVGSVLLTFGTALAPGPLPAQPSVVNPFGISIGGEILSHRLFGTLLDLGLLLCLLSLLASVGVPILRLHRARGERRQQLKWFVYAAALTAMGFSGIFISIIGLYFTSDPLNTIVWYLGPFALILLPISTGIAILRYRLYDIDVITSRTLVYGALSASVVGLYVLVVGAAGALFQARGSFVVSLLAVGLVAVVFQPLRSRLQRGVNHLMYGERDEPHKVLARLGRRLEIVGPRRGAQDHGGDDRTGPEAALRGDHPRAGWHLRDGGRVWDLIGRAPRPATNLRARDDRTACSRPRSPGETSHRPISVRSKTWRGRSP